MSIRMLLAAAVLPAVLSASAYAITPTVFTTPGLGPGTIGFAYVGDGFVGSVQQDGAGALYSTDLNGGSITLFSPATVLNATVSSEHYVSSSLGLGGFPNRDVYVASGNNIQHISHSGVGDAGLFIAGGLNGIVRGISFDAVGTFNHDMLVTTNAGSVYTVDSAGTATLIASTGEDTEGLDVAPTGAGAKWGAFNGDLFVASEGSGNIRAIDPITHAVTIVASVASAEELDFVPLNLGSSGNPVEGLYGADYTPDVVKFDASQFTGLQGDIVITGETTHVVSDIDFNGGTPIVSSIGNFPNQPEDGLFVTAAVIIGSGIPEPASLSLLGLVQRP